MSTEALLQSAQFLSAPGEAAHEYGTRSDALVAAMNARFFTRPDWATLIGGEHNRGMAEDNHRNHARFMQNLFAHFDPEVLANIVPWVYRTYRSHGFVPDYWPAMLADWMAVMREELSPETVAETEPVYRWIRDHHEELLRLSD